MPTLTKEKILEALRTVRDPELDRDIVSLGMVTEVGTEGDKAFVGLQIINTPPAAQEAIKKEVEQKVSEIPGVTDVTVQLAEGPRRSPAFSAKMPIEGIKRVVAVASGKGGVGKTTVAVNLAFALSKLGLRVGLMDADIYGPNVPMMLGVPSEVRPGVSDNEKMIPIEVHGLKMISMGVLVPPDQPMVWRGPMLHSAVTQFVQKVEWGELDYLLVDLPPGTGDVQLSLVQVVPLSGAVIVTTPQEVALADVRKGIAMFQKTNVPILGVIENMSGDVFGAGGGEKTARDFGVPFLGSIPLDLKIRQGGDLGKPIVIQDNTSVAARALMDAAKTLTERLVPRHPRTGLGGDPDTSIPA